MVIVETREWYEKKKQIQKERSNGGREEKKTQRNERVITECKLCNIRKEKKLIIVLIEQSANHRM